MPYICLQVFALDLSSVVFSLFTNALKSHLESDRVNLQIIKLYYVFNPFIYPAH